MRRISKRYGRSKFGVSKSFTVYLHGKQIDRVFADQSMSPDEVRRSLINHDGYDSAIVVRRHVVRR